MKITIEISDIYQSTLERFSDGVTIEQSVGSVIESLLRRELKNEAVLHIENLSMEEVAQYLEGVKKDKKETEVATAAVASE